MSETPVCDYCHGVGACPTCWGRSALAEARAALSAAEKERDEARRLKDTTEAMWKSCTRQVADERDAAEKREARLRDWLRALHREVLDSESLSVECGLVVVSNCPECEGALEKHDAGCELASAASEAQPPPASPGASSTQEGD